MSILDKISPPWSSIWDLVDANKYHAKYIFAGCTIVLAIDVAYAFFTRMRPHRVLSRGKCREMILKDGRTLGWAECGDPAGFTVFLLHGNPGGRADGIVYDESARAHHVRVITVSRPGFEASTQKPHRTLLDFANDIVELADKLAVPRFGVIGVSGGAAYAAAVAYQTPSRVAKVVIVSGVAELTPEIRSALSINSRIMIYLTPYLYYINRLQSFFTLRCSPLWDKPRCFAIKLMARFQMEQYHRVAAADYQYLDEMVFSAYENALDTMDFLGPNTCTGLYTDLNIIQKSWGFNLTDIQVPAYIFHGRYDQALYANSFCNIPGSKLTLVDHGHVGCWFSTRDDVINIFS